MSELSDYARIDQIAETNPETLSGNSPGGYAFRYIDLGSADKGKINWNSIGWTSFIDAPSRARRKVTTGDVLYGTVRPYLQAHGSVPDSEQGPLIASTGFCVIRARAGQADPRFLFHSILGNVVQAQADRNAVGSSYPAVNDTDVSGFVIYAPRLPEQSKIAEVLDTLDEAIRGTEAVVAKLKAMKQGLLHDLLTRGIDTNGDLRPPVHEAPHLYHETPLGWLPKGWEFTNVGMVLSRIDSGWSPACIEEPPPPGEWGVLKVSAVTRGFYDDRESKTLPTSFKPRPALEVSEGDVILTRANGVAELVGKAVQVQNTQEKLMLSDKLLRIVPEKQRMTNDFLALLMASDVIVRQIEKSMSGSSGQKNISQSQIKAFDCYRPPLDEQKLIYARVKAIGEAVTTDEKLLNKLRLQKSGLMDDLLTGRVSVTPLL